jgi:hypothetical protein
VGVSRDLALLSNVLASLRATKVENKSDEIADRMRVTFPNGYQANIIRGSAQSRIGTGPL